MARHRTDGQHAEVRDGLRKVIRPDRVRDVSQSEIGCDLIAPDLIDGCPRFLEVKPKRPPSARILSTNEAGLFHAFPLRYHVVSTLEEALIALSYQVLP